MTVAPRSRVGAIPTALSLSALILAVAAPAARAQTGTITYRLGHDTIAVERFTRAPTRLTGEMVSRSGAAVVRTQYDLTLANGRVTAAVVRRLQADGRPLANGPAEYRFTFRADSVRREAVWPDSTQARTFAAPNAFPSLPAFAYGPLEVLRSMPRHDSVPALGITSNAVGFLGIETLPDGTERQRGGSYPVLLRFDASGLLQSVDGTLTANKSIGTRGSDQVDIAALAAAMKPTGALSPRMTAYAAFSQGPIFINYGSPAVRGRTVWGGTLIPLDSIWRVGANEAAHLATSKTIQLGDMTLAPGLYTVWIQHTQAATWLIVNRQVGQWGTAYDAANDIGRVQMTLAQTPATVEDFTITIRSLGQNRGSMEFAWGDQAATATFTVRP